MARKTTYSLDYQPDYDFLLIGIFSAQRDYRVCFELNRKLGLDLVRQDDLELKVSPKASAAYYPLFSAKNENDEQFILLGNKGNNGFFIPELKQVDFFLLIRNATRYTDPDALISELRSIRHLSSAIQFVPEELKSAENFLLVETA